MKRMMIALSCLALLASPAFGQSIGEKTGINATLGITPSTADFVREAAISDMFEIESNKLGQQRGSPAQKTFATQMVADHTKTSTELKSMVSSGKVKAEIPTALDSAHRSKLDKLNGYQGDDFAKNFASMQVDAHQDAVSLFERYSTGGDNPQLKEWATRTLPVLKHHLDMAQGLDRK
jgi:putative membrane protein